MSYTKFNFSFYITCCCLSLGLVNANAQTSSKNFFAEQLTEENWDRMLIGEWMVEFYAPWCPACKTLEPIWEHLAAQKENLNINVGKVDVTDSPGLSGRFMVTALPTIYHVKNGIFRQYKSPRDKDSLIEFVSEKTWEKIEPIPGWKSPTSIQMSVIGQFFQISQVLRGIHNRFMEDFGLPTWGSYLIIAIATIVSGAILGLFIVCLIDFIYPPKPVMLQNKKKQKDGSGGFMQEKSIQDEEIVEHVKDDLVDEESEQEGSETEEKEKDADKDSKTEPSSPNVRKRKPRKADSMAKVNTIKNMKKRSASTSELSEKKTEILENVNKQFKKKKTENGTIINGQPNKQIAKNLPKKSKNEKRNDLEIAKNPKKKATNEIGLQKSKKQTLTTAELLKLRQEYRKKRKENRLSQTHTLSNLSVEDIKRKIESIEKRSELTRSAKRRLAALKKRLRVEEVGNIKQAAKKQLEKGRNEKSFDIAKQKQMQTIKSKQEKVDAKSNKENKKRDAKKSKTLLKQKNEENDDDDEEDEENEDNVEIDDDLSEDVDGTDVEEGDDVDDDDEEEEEEEDDDDDDDDDDEEDVEEEGKNDKSNEQDRDNEIKKNNVQKGKGKSANVEEDGKKKRYVLFVGNLPYNITNEELKKHFLTKVSQVVDIRIPRKDENTARGFAYVELANNTDYEKALSLNHSFVNGRRINVQYSGPDRRTAVAKNFKLHALQKAGKFAGGRNRYNQKYANNKGKQNMRTAKI
ncbi:uncharacterized protein [Bombus fervidus]|uniref:uncharacterized protein n=1 Tax=Bombus fervidus TaxID=203811 RepID=UPI003AB5A008